jgi:hypothetical protein
MSLRSKYARQVRETFGRGYHAAWLPDTPHEIGSYGRMEDDVFVSCGNIRELGVAFTVDVDRVPSALTINASRGVAVTSKLKGETNAGMPHVPQASAGLALEFKSEGSFAIAAEETYEDRIKDPGKLEEELRRVRSKGKWDSSYRVVTGVIRMPVATILISSSDDTKLEMSLEGTATPAVRELGKASVSANFRWESSSVMKFSPARNAMPILQLHRLKSGFLFFPPRLRTFAKASARDGGAKEEWSLALDDGEGSPA